MRLHVLQRIYSGICLGVAGLFIGPALYYLSSATLAEEGVMLVALAGYGGLFLATALLVLRRSASGAWLAGFTGALFVLNTISLLFVFGQRPLLAILAAPIAASAAALGIYLASKIGPPPPAGS